VPGPTVRANNAAGTGRGIQSVTTDGQPPTGGMVLLRDDGRAHEVGMMLA